VFETTGTLFNSATLHVSFLGSNGEFQVNTATDGTVTFETSGLNAGPSTTTPTNFFDFAGESLTTTSKGTGTTGTVVLSNGDTLALTGITGGAGGWVAKTASDGSGGTDVFLAVCFAAGTRILTPLGERAVETLAEGDLVLAGAGDELVACPIKWLGYRRIDLTSHPRPTTVAPICIMRSAISDAIPHNDLCVSPDHGILIDGKLICARQLVNDTTIREVTGLASVQYFHIELDAHNILLAEGLAAESYLDTGNRSFFANVDEPLLLHPDLTDELDYPTRKAGSCVPFVWDEATVRPIWQRLADRAAAIGRPVQKRATTTEPNLRLLATCPEHRSVKPIQTDGGIAVFVLPRGVKEVRLVSRAQSAIEARPWMEDRRKLGVRLKRIVLRGAAELCEIPLDHPDLTTGWWAVERDGGAMRRWTDGDAVLPLPAIDENVALEIHLADEMTYVVETEVPETGRVAA